MDCIGKVIDIVRRDPRDGNAPVARKVNMEVGRETMDLDWL